MQQLTPLVKSVFCSAMGSIYCEQVMGHRLGKDALLPVDLVIYYRGLVVGGYSLVDRVNSMFSTKKEGA